MRKIWAGHDGRGCLNRYGAPTPKVVTGRRPGPCWLPSGSSPSKAEEKQRRKTVGDVDKPAPQAAPGVRKVPDSKTRELLGKLVDDVSLFEGVAKRPIKSANAVAKLATQVGVDEDGGTSLSVDRAFTAITAKRAIAMLVKGECSRLDDNDRESDDGNIRYYKEHEAKKIVGHLVAQAGRTGQLYVAGWDDISSEYKGSMLAAVKPDGRSVTFAQVICFRP